MRKWASEDQKKLAIADAASVVRMPLHEDYQSEIDSRVAEQQAILDRQPDKITQAAACHAAGAIQQLRALREYFVEIRKMGDVK